MKKAARMRTASMVWRRLLLLRGFFGFHRGLFPLDVGLAAFFMFVFIVLFAHKCLYFVRGLRFCVCTMNFYAGRFNLYLLALLALTLAVGCSTPEKKEKKKEDEFLGAIRLHIESTMNALDTSQTVSILRAQPVSITIAKEPVLSELNLLHVRLMETPGGFAIELKFDDTATLTLEQFTSAYAGKHFAIFGQWGEKKDEGRWLAAPLITTRNATGILAFTPDMSHAEAVRFVTALNRAAKKAQKDK
jgi:hypothetical protein